MQTSPVDPSQLAHVFFEGAPQKEALARLNYLVENNFRAGVVEGEPGTGKSLLLRTFANSLRGNRHIVVQLSLLGIDADEFIWSVAKQLGTPLPASARRFAVWHRVADRLCELRYQQVAAVLLLDDTDESSSELRNHVVRLLQLDPSPNAQRTAILAADRADRLGRRLLELCQLRVDLEPWDVHDTSEYLRTIVAATDDRAVEFDECAINRIQQLSQGNPRRISQLVQLSAVASQAAGNQRIDEQTIDAIYEELTVAPLVEI